MKRKPALMRMSLEQLIAERDEMAAEIRENGGTPGVRPKSRVVDSALLRWWIHDGLVNEIKARGEAQ